ncbi:MAG: DUF3105 domain-containing protein [Acidimicrobiales bacterium]
MGQRSARGGAAAARAAAAGLAALAAVVGLVGLAACGGGDGGGACRPAEQTPLQADSGHVLPGGAAPSYLTEPPTSGPHQPVPSAGRAYEEPLSRPVQVGLLEAGGVLLQHRGLAPDAAAELAELAGGLVTVAPNPDLDSAVVATAWRRIQRCERVERAELERFVARYAGQGPGAH